MKTLFAVLALITFAALAAPTNVLTGRQRMELRRAEMLARRTNTVTATIRTNLPRRVQWTTNAAGIRIRKLLPK